MGLDPLSGGVIAIAAGIGISLLWNERTGSSPGGPIAPGLLALVALRSPIALLLVPLAAVMSGLATDRMARRVYLYGRRRYAMLLLVGMIAVLAVDGPLHLLGGPWPLGIVAYIVPGMVAYDFQRQGYARTVVPFIMVTIFVSSIVLLLDAMGN
ncbi:MAG: poly-gamma-glutamate biosynthesis protein PgsC/CapC [Thermoplasmata archaeon]|nr:poly-gamma-glutamate biosynthesis protein PgsC/CapC [Thermoplasmata archaeon]